MRDQKAALGNSIKPDTTHVRRGIRVYIARACEYGSAKYERANYLRIGSSTKEAFLVLRSYLRATQDHIGAVLDAMELHQAHDPDLVDVQGMLRACYAADTSEDSTHAVGPSRLPHIAHAAASVMMAIEKSILAGVLPADPGRPWESRGEIVEVPEDPEEDWAASITQDIRPPSRQDGYHCHHGAPIGLTCADCGGLARRA